MTRRPGAGRVLAVVAGLAWAVALAGCAEEPQGAQVAGGPTGPVGATVTDPVPAEAQAAPVPGSAGISPVPGSPGASAAASLAVPTDLATPFTCPQPTATVLDGDELRAALKAAEPGDVIGLERGTYAGNFTITRSGTAQRPIYLCGPREAVLDARGQSSGYTLHLDGASHWRLDGFAVRSGQKGIMLDAATSVVLQALHVSESGDEAVHLRKNSTDNVVQSLVIRKAGLLNPTYGEGLYVGTAESNWCELTACAPDRSDRNLLLNNRISDTTAESVDLKEGTSDGVLSGNTFDGRGMVASSADSWVDVKGNGWTVSGNRGQNSPKDGFQLHVILSGWGDRNTFTGNTSRLSTASGTGIMLEQPLQNVVRCDNATTGGNPYGGPCQG